MKYNKIENDEFVLYVSEGGLPKAEVYKETKFDHGYQYHIIDNLEVHSQSKYEKYLMPCYVYGDCEETFEKATKAALQKLDEINNE